MSQLPCGSHRLAHSLGVIVVSATIVVLSVVSSSFAQDASPAPMGSPPVIEHSSPDGVTETAQRLMPFPFTPPDVKVKQDEPLSGSNDWFTKHDKKKIDQLGALDFYATSGAECVGVVPKLHNTSAGMEIYELPPNEDKQTFEQKEGPYRSGITKKYSNKRSGKKVAKFKMSPTAQPALACFYVSRLLGDLVSVPPATYRTMAIQEFTKVGNQARTTGNTSCTAAWANLRQAVQGSNPRFVLPGGKLVFGSIADNPRGEDSSPQDYWTVSSIRGHSFYRVLSSRSPVATVLKLSDPKSLQDLALAQDMTRGVILDSIFRQVDRLGNISVGVFQHYVTHDGKVKWDDNPSDEDKADAVSPIQPLKRIIYKDNDDGMNWNTSSITVAPILAETHHLDQTVYNRLQWLAGLMQDSEPGANAKIKDYFVNAVHISGDNYDHLQQSVIKQAAALKSRVASKDIQLDLDFEGTMKKLYPPPAATPSPAMTPAASVAPASTPEPSLAPTSSPAATP